jgi:hypothetical protein
LFDLAALFIRELTNLLPAGTQRGTFRTAGQMGDCVGFTGSVDPESTEARFVRARNLANDRSAAVNHLTVSYAASGIDGDAAARPFSGARKRIVQRYLRRTMIMSRKVLIALPELMLNQADMVAEFECRSRSDLMREALRRYLKHFNSNRSTIADDIQGIPSAG